MPAEWIQRLRERLRANAPHMSEAQVDAELEECVSATESGRPFGAVSAENEKDGSDGDSGSAENEKTPEQIRREKAARAARRLAAQAGRLW